MPSALSGHDLVLGYARATVVHGVSIGLESGRVTALIGPNGSGKSTV
ncbi:MAG TPA: ATP-binding cassette domain-containing protein, partial [Nocardioides sp.]